MKEIKFGTDGWRGIISLDFTFDNVKKVAQAIADYTKELKEEKKSIIVGYDNRFLSSKYAETIACILAGNGLKVYLVSESVSTPTLSLAVKEKKCSGGIMITASHNPPIYNGIKIKGSYGGSATPEIIQKIEAKLNQNEIKEISLEKGLSSQEIEIVNIISPYLTLLKNKIMYEKIKKQKYKIIVDTMYGTGKDIIAKILDGTNCKVITLHNIDNPGFGGLTPEPLKVNLTELIEKVKQEKADLGLATDGDGDRIGVISSEGEFIDANHIFALLLLHLIRNKKWQGKVIKTISTSSLINAICQKYNFPSIEVPVGFKYICELMIKDDILIGGEESGGFGFKNYIPEKDGILSGLLLLEMMAIQNKSINEILKEIEGEFGQYKSSRIDLKCDFLKINKLKCWLKENTPQKICNILVKEKNDLDGTKFILEDNSWLLLRSSGTEPLLRIYAEAKTMEKTYALLKEGKRILEEV